MEQPSLYVLAARAHGALRKHFDRVFEDADLGSLDVQVLFAIANGKRRTIASLARDVGEGRTALSRRLRVLEKEGLIELSRENHSRTRPKLTLAGRDFVAVAGIRWRSEEAKLLVAVGLQAGAARELLDVLGGPLP